MPANHGSLDESQLNEIETLAAAGLGPAGIIGELALSPNFTHSEIESLAGSTGSSGSAGADSSGSSGSGGSGSGKGKGKKGKGHGGGGGGEWGIIHNLLPRVKKGDSSLQTASSGNPYAPPTALNPSTIGGSSGGSSIMLIGVVVVIGVVGFLLFRKHKGEPKK